MTLLIAGSLHLDVVLRAPHLPGLDGPRRHAVGFGMTDGFLNKVYSARNAEETRDLYDAWAASYDAEIRENGYATPGRCAAALAQFSDNLDGPILDFGCGTGLSGVALRLAGFTHIDGVDLSADMLRGAQDKNVYNFPKMVKIRI